MMDMQILIKTQDGKFSGLEQKPQDLNNNTGIEFFHPLPTDIGQGGFYNLTCRQGLSLCLNRSRLDRDYHAKVTWASSPKVTFAFCLSGRISTQNNCRKSPMEIATGDALVYYFKDSHLEQITQGEKTVRTLAVHFTPETLVQLAIPFNGQGSEAEESLRKALKMGELYLSQPMTPRMICLLRDVITCPHKGMFRKLFLESRTLELIACHLEQALLQDTRRAYARPLTPEDRDRITCARDILVGRLHFPPALPDLAREVGMSHTRLTRGFKKLYGCTVFEYLRNKRLNYGRTLLEKNLLSITEVAFEAGFSSSSHFAAAFQRFYGVSPSCYRYRFGDRGRTSLAQ
jgi:AraC family transcriptional regulator, transcriptional activator of the genes for pyochelin and ferripyochelin receptors